MAAPSAELMGRVQRAMSHQQKAIIAAEVVDQQVRFVRKCQENRRQTNDSGPPLSLSSRLKTSAFSSSYSKTAKRNWEWITASRLTYFLFSSIPTSACESICTRAYARSSPFLHVSSRQNRFATRARCARDRTLWCCRRE